MSITAFNGFESGVGGDGLASGTFSLATSPTRGAWSTYSFRSNPTTTGTGYYAVLGTNGTLLSTSANLGSPAYFTFYFYISTLPASGNEEFADVVAKMQLRVSDAGVISAYNGTTLIATGTAILTTATWYKIQIACGTGAGAIVQVKVNGTTDINTTATLSSSNTGSIRLGKVTNRNGNSVDFYYDDCIVSNSAYVDAVKIARLIPDANGTYQTFTVGAGAGSHYQVVGVVPPGVGFTTSYLVSTVNPGDAETEAIQDASVKGITPNILAASQFVPMIRDGASNGRVKVRLRSGSTNTDSVAFATTSGVQYSCTINETDPATGAAWTTSGISGTEVGLVQDTGGQKTRMCAAFLMVAFDDSPPSNTVAPSCTPVSGTTADTFTFSPGTWTGSPTSYETSVSVDGGAYSVIDTSAGGTPEKTGAQLGGPGTIATRVRAQNAGGWSDYTAGTTLTVTSGGSPYSINGRPFKTKRINGRPS